MGSRFYGIPKVDFVLHLWWHSPFSKTSLLLFGVETLFGNVGHLVPNICRLCVGVVFFLCFAYLCCSHESIGEIAQNSKELVLFFEVVLLQQHVWSVRFHAPQFCFSNFWKKSDVKTLFFSNWQTSWRVLRFFSCT